MRRAGMVCGSNDTTVGARHAVPLPALLGFAAATLHPRHAAPRSARGRIIDVYTEIDVEKTGKAPELQRAG